MGRRVVLIVALLGVPLAAQGVTSYEIRYYRAGAATPFYQQTLPPWAYACNQPPVPSGSSVNPGRVVWDDPAMAGRVCIFADLQAWAVWWFPAGNYEGTLAAVNAAGSSPESLRAPFSVVAGAPPAAPTTVRVVR